MGDAQRELHQRSLRNVRILLEKEQEEFERQRRAKKLLAWALVPAVLLAIAVLAMRNPVQREPVEMKRTACASELLAQRSGEAERAIRSANPGISGADVGQRLRREGPGIHAAAVEECKRRHPS